MWIYKITNNINNKSYIGQTTQDNPFRRIRYHFNGRIYNTGKSLIKLAINKYGKENFNVEIIYQAQDLDELNNKEQEFIKQFNTINPHGYNLDYGGRNKRWSHEMREYLGKVLNSVPPYFKGKKFSKEHCESLSKVRKGFDSPARKLARQKGYTTISIKVIAKNINTNETYNFNSFSEAGRILGIESSNISRVCRGKDNRRQVGGYTFTTEKYKGTELPLLPDNPMKGISKINKGGYSLKLDKIYLGYRSSLDGILQLKNEYLKKKLDKLE